MPRRFRGSEGCPRTREDEGAGTAVTCRYQRIQRAQHIDLSVTARVLDRINDAGAGREVHDRVDPTRGGRQGFGISDVALDELLVSGRLGIRDLAGHETVVGNRSGPDGPQAPSQIHADESRAAGDEHGLTVQRSVVQAGLGHDAEI